MNVALRTPWTAERFLDWAERQEERYEFDGVAPVAMTGGTARHNLITINIHGSLRARLRGTSCSPFGPDLGIETVQSGIRYPDALITCTKFRQSEKIAPNPVVVFEVVSPTSGRLDRIVKLREYAAVPSILVYVIVDSEQAGLQVFSRGDGTAAWTVQPLTADETLELPQVAIAVPVAELYDDVSFDEDEVGG